MCRDEDDRNSATLIVQLRLQLEAGHPWHTDVRDQTGNLLPLPDFRNSSADAKLVLASQPLSAGPACAAHQLIIIKGWRLVWHLFW